VLVVVVVVIVVVIVVLYMSSLMEEKFAGNRHGGGGGGGSSLSLQHKEHTKATNKTNYCTVLLVLCTATSRCRVTPRVRSYLQHSSTVIAR